MGLFKKKEKKQNGEEFLLKLALQEALRELEEEREKNKSLRKDLKLFDKASYDDKAKNDNLNKNLEVMQTTIENIKKMCENKKGKVISVNAILRELGEE